MECKGYTGDILNLLTSEQSNITWQSLIYGVPRGVMGFAMRSARLDKVGRSDKLRRNTGKGTPVTAELVGMHMARGKLPIWSSSSKYI